MEAIVGLGSVQASSRYSTHGILLSARSYLIHLSSMACHIFPSTRQVPAKHWFMLQLRFCLRCQSPGSNPPDSSQFEQRSREAAHQCIFLSYYLNNNSKFEPTQAVRGLSRGWLRPHNPVQTRSVRAEEMEPKGLSFPLPPSCWEEDGLGSFQGPRRRVHTIWKAE